ncbi:MAG: Sua5 family C-terminal domain-containing protein [Bacteroidota bacterium]
MLREFDAMDVDILIAEEVPDEGLGRAINDRFTKSGCGPG